MKILTSLSLFLCIFGNTIQAQYASMVGKPYPQKLDAIHRLYEAVIDQRMDSLAVADTLAGMRWLGAKEKDAELGLEADLLDAYYRYRFGSKRIEPVREVFEAGQRKQVMHIALRAAYVVALHYWSRAEYEAAMRWYLRLDELMHPIGVNDFPNKAEYLKDIGVAYYHFLDYDQAIHYFRQVADLPIQPFYERAWTHAVNTMGLAFQHLGQLDASDACFQKIIDSVRYRAEPWKGIAMGNMGYNQYLRGNFAEAKPLLAKDIRIAEQYGDLGLAAGSCIPLGAILLKEGALREAGEYLDKAGEYIRRSGQTDRLRLLYPELGKWHAAMNHAAQASAYLDSALLANKAYNDKFSALQLLRANQEAQASQREAAVQALRTEGQRQVNRRNLVLACLLIAMLLVVLVAYRQQQRNRMHLKERDLKLMATDHELQDARRQLEELARAAAKKEELAGAVENGKLIEQLNRQVVLTDEGWATFSELFGKLYPGFQHQLKVRCPLLTPAEIRCLAMEKLYYTNKEMAALQGISANAVAVTKHRIRRKLGLDTQADLVDFVNRI